MIVKQERFEYTHPIEMEDEVFHVREMLPYAAKEQMA